MARPSKQRCICSKPQCTGFSPDTGSCDETIQLGYDEYETLRLIDYLSFTQEQCAERMQVSRTTVTRMYESARRKTAEALVCGKRLKICGGDVIVCAGPRPECAGEANCCHRKSEVAKENTE